MTLHLKLTFSDLSLNKYSDVIKLKNTTKGIYCLKYNFLKFFLNDYKVLIEIQMNKFQNIFSLKIKTFALLNSIKEY